jgi:hypothetical protein
MTWASAVSITSRVLAQKGELAEAKTQKDAANTSADELLKILADEKAKRSDRLHRALVLTVAPPTALLLLGIAISWVARAFRKINRT